ncbi:protein Aatf [Uranotaenia lowii]|uniref:protein Aatf n=1 Tax=Uranotaenia lowii TaxID=190385 RepID=UPI0024785C72|nr:protein Aatf [Uranotaenia lowii]
MQKFKPKGRTPKTVSEKIHAQLTGQRGLGFAGPGSDSSEADDDDDGGGGSTRPRLTEFDENDLELERISRRGLSDIRKQNAQLLDSVDQKYQGKVSSRKDVFEDEIGSEDSDKEDRSDVEDMMEDVDESEGEHDTIRPGAFVRLKSPENSSEQDEGSEFEDDVESEEEDSGEEDDSEIDDDQFNLGDFLGNSSSQMPSQKLLQDENRQESIQKGICVQNQLQMWERLLEMRIKMQSSIVTANSLPTGEKFTAFLRDDKFKETSDGILKSVDSTLSNLLELQGLLASRFPETKNLLKPGSKRKSKDLSGKKDAKTRRLHEFETTISNNFSCFKPYRNDVIQKWHDRVRASSNIKNANQTMNIIRKIESSLLAKDELIKKTQQYRGGYELFEKPTQPVAIDSENSNEPEPVFSGEIFDDSDFYHALLRELIEFKSNTVENPQEIGAKLAELQKLRSKMKKQVDTRASKGRKIRYVVHKKLVNFMAPEDRHEWTDEAKNELFSSLFGGTAENGTG